MEDYFTEQINEFRKDYNFMNLITKANKKDCEEKVHRDKTLFHNSCVDSYNLMSAMVENYRETGVFTDDDTKELADATYTYYYVLRYVARNLNTEGKEFEYDKESIDELIANFKKSLQDIYLYLQHKANQD